MDGLLGVILLYGAFFAAIYFLLIRPQQKKSKKLADLRNSIKPGDEIITIGGLIGRVLSVKEDDFVLEVGASKTKMHFKRWAVSAVESASAEDVVTVEDSNPEV